MNKKLTKIVILLEKLYKHLIFNLEWVNFCFFFNFLKKVFLTKKYNDLFFILFFLNKEV